MFSPTTVTRASKSRSSLGAGDVNLLQQPDDREPATSISPSPAKVHQQAHLKQFSGEIEHIFTQFFGRIKCVFLELFLI
ncbi:hypothetical protein RchiOBHm_Chr4g0441031 [Rosa chinensis]|uniref:Uncharacterized protein n=1 Tax=Rosa chinensis TaxID=74649 RepID=A0A2P6R3A2_ROSCH|nr:hypothetical protein RchiOBHm_Chr4g0441031 [Rosa chinensis]